MNSVFLSVQIYSSVRFVFFSREEINDLSRQTSLRRLNSVSTDPRVQVQNTHKHTHRHVSKHPRVCVCVLENIPVLSRSSQGGGSK